MGTFLRLSNPRLHFHIGLRLVFPKVNEAVLVVEKSSIKVNGYCSFYEMYLTIETPCRAKMVDFRKEVQTEVLPLPQYCLHPSLYKLHYPSSVFRLRLPYYRKLLRYWVMFAVSRSSQRYKPNATSSHTALPDFVLSGRLVALHLYTRD